MSDNEIWGFAKENNLVILTKDSDFYFKSIREESLVKVVYFKLGNQELSDLHKYFSNNWDLIKELIKNNRLVLASVNEVEIIL
jgi:predicted nuclease of predicted toxin-antitoxin system